MNEIPKTDIWARIAAPIPAGLIQWRQDGRPAQRDGKWFARFVAYVDSQFVRERLDLVVPGEWDLTLEMLPMAGDEDGVAQCSFKARLQVLGVIREDVGTGKDYKTAASDAFKRAAMRFGVAHELYAYEQNWVQVDGDGKYAKPLEDPNEAYARRQRRTGEPPRGSASVDRPEHGSDAASHRGGESPSAAPSGPLANDDASCPKCGGRMFDNRLSKRNPKAPDFKCRNRSCDGVIWPPRNGTATAPQNLKLADTADDLDESQAYEDEREIPF